MSELLVLHVVHVMMKPDAPPHLTLAVISL